MKIFIPLALILSLALSCNEDKDIQIKTTLSKYYQTYQERSDFQKFLSFYAEDMVLEDIMLGERKLGKKEFAEFFDWDNPDFSLVDSTALVIENQIIEGREVVSQGYFSPFKWGDFTFGAMYFTTILEFNEKGKIIKQVDWINYPKELVDYNTRKNSNAWIE